MKAGLVPEQHTTQQAVSIVPFVIYCRVFDHVAASVERHEEFGQLMTFILIPDQCRNRALAQLCIHTLGVINSLPMESEAILALYDVEQRINIEFPGVRKKRRPHLLRYVSETGGPHFILYSRLAGADVEAVIAEEQAYFGPLGEVEWKVYAHDRPADLRQRLVARGFEAEEPEAIMVLDLEEAPHRGVSTPPSGVTVRRLENASQLEDVRQIEETVWEEDFAWITESLAADLAVPGYLSVYVAYVEGQPACAGWIYFYPNSQFAGLWGGSTVPEQRKRGLYTAVLAARVQEAAARGYRFLTIDASPMSRPIAARHGFRLLTMAWPCKWGKDL